MSAIADVEIEEVGALHADRQVARREIYRELLHSPAFVIGALVLLFWIVCAIFGSLIAPHDPYAQTLLNINKSPSSSHWFGTDQLGRDMFSRVIVGSRDILVIAPLATLLGTVWGTALGLVMGYFRGAVDDVLGRVVEAFLALPLIARTVRAAVLQERDLDYVSAARLRGEGSLYIMFVEILPNVFSPIVVEFTVRLAYAIFTVLTLTFLGFGVQPPSPDWGLDIATNYGVVTAGFWWEVLFDALAIASLVVAVTLVSESIEGVLER